MTFIEEPIRKTPVFDNVDVLVIGGGPSRLSAALASAREGVYTLLLERYGCFGGVISQVGVEGVAWYRHEKTVESGGLLTEFESLSKEIGGSTKEPQSDSEAIDAEMFKIVADNLICNSGVKPLLHCLAVDVVMDGDTIKGVIFESKSGRYIILSKIIIDCSGDADVAYKAGASYFKRKKSELMDVTQLFNLRGVNVEKFNYYVKNILKPTYKDWGGEVWSQICNEESMFSPYMEKPFLKAYENKLIKERDNLTLGGTWSTVSKEGDLTQMNMVFMNHIDCTDIEDLTKAEIVGRAAALDIIKVLNNLVPGCENARLRNFGMSLGTRDSRIIDGVGFLTESYVRNEGRCENSIGIQPDFIDGFGVLHIPTDGKYYQIPYECLLPKKIKNLLVAGRTISGDKIAFCSFRNMSCCTVTGQGAGVAAAIAVKNKQNTYTVDIKKVQKSLMQQGVRIN